jgi:thiol:disulfide interchange protein DsbA
MKRRQFSSASLALFVSAPALAQRVPPIEGVDYISLVKPQAVPPGKIDVIEFFWYGCPHCYAFEPTLETWVAALPKDISFRRVPVAFRQEPFVEHQKIFYALAALGQVDQMHKKVFAAIHLDHQRLDKPADIAALMTKNGIDAASFLAAYNSQAVQDEARHAAALSDAFQIDGVPSLGVEGRFFTSGTMAGSQERALVVAEFLVDKVRKGS